MKEISLVKTGNFKIDLIWLSKAWTKGNENLLKIIQKMATLKRRRKRIDITVNQTHNHLDRLAILILVFHFQTQGFHQCNHPTQCMCQWVCNLVSMVHEHLQRILICLILCLTWAILQLLLQRLAILSIQRIIREELKMKNMTKMQICSLKRNSEKMSKEEIF